MKLPIRFRAFRASGAGGQHKNVTMSAIEASVTLPDGRVIRAVAQGERSQHRNKAAASAVLKARVYAALQPAHERRETVGWGNVARRVRTYHEPDNRVVDSAGPRFTYREIVGRGEIGPAIQARAAALAASSPP